MRVRMNTTYASERGNAGPGQVIDLPEAEAEQLIAGRYAAALASPKAKPAAAAPVPTPETPAPPAEEPADPAGTEETAAAGKKRKK